MKKETVVIFVEVFLGPTMTFIQNQITELRKNYNVIIIANELANKHLFSEPVLVVKLDIFSRIVGYFGRKFGLFYCIAPLRLWFIMIKIKRSNNIVCAICHFGTAGLQVGSVMNTLKIPYSTIIHGSDGSSLLSNTAYRSHISLSKNSKFIFASRSLLENFKKSNLFLNKTAVIHLGIKNNCYNYKSKNCNVKEKFNSNNEIIFFQASNFITKKGHEYTICAFNKFVQIYPKAKLYLAGDGPLRKRIQHQVDKLGIIEKVIFLGHISMDEVKKYFQQVDVFLHHSVTGDNGDQESIPTVIMEAMSYRIPVISTYHAGIPELIISGHNGYLVKEKDIESYYNAILFTLNSDIQLGLNAYETITNNFSFEKKVNEVINFTIT